MPAWRVEETGRGLRLAPVTRRRLGSQALTWADLLYSQLSAAQIYVLYFPSRFELPVDAAIADALRDFGAATGEGTLVAFWDTTDPEFSRALSFFDVASPPALVLATGLKTASLSPTDIDPPNLYAMTITDQQTLADRARLATAVNSAHEVMVRADAKEIARYLRARETHSLLAAIGHIAAGLRDEVLKFKPHLQLPGGVSISLG